MRSENPEWDQLRQVHPQLGKSEHNWGYFLAGQLRIISSGTPDPGEDGYPWEHVSVSKTNGKMPTWGEMCRVKEMSWKPEEVVVQFHPRESEYVNFHESCLHLWRSITMEFPTPPSILVGPATEEK